MEWVKLSIDGSFSNHSAGLGMVLRDTEGLPIFPACNHLDNCQVPLEAELRAGVEGLKLALAHSHLSIIEESDSSLLIEVAKASSMDRSPFSMGFMKSEV
jgi:hypothetical protein